MALPCYLAMTGSEMEDHINHPKKIAWFSCHFSHKNQGLTNMPSKLPAGSIIILDDSQPPVNHDSELIAKQLQDLAATLSADGVLLDFQRPGNPQTAAIAAALSKALPCPVCVSDIYAEKLNCPVFLPPSPLHIPLTKHIKRWKGREIWLEAAIESQILSIKSDGAISIPSNSFSGSGNNHIDPILHCGYSTEVHPDSIDFTLFDTPELLPQKLQEAENLGIQKVIGLYQQLGKFFET